MKNSVHNADYRTNLPAWIPCRSHDWVCAVVCVIRIEWVFASFKNNNLLKYSYFQNPGLHSNMHFNRPQLYDWHDRHKLHRFGPLLLQEQKKIARYYLHLQLCIAYLSGILSSRRRLLQCLEHSCAWNSWQPILNFSPLDEKSSLLRRGRRRIRAWTDSEPDSQTQARSAYRPGSGLGTCKSFVRIQTKGTEPTRKVTACGGGMKKTRSRLSWYTADSRWSQIVSFRVILSQLGWHPRHSEIPGISRSSPVVWSPNL